MNIRSAQIAAHKLSMVLQIIKERISLPLVCFYLFSVVSCSLSLLQNKYNLFLITDSVPFIKYFFSWGNFLVEPLLFENNYFYLFNFICWSLSGLFFSSAYIRSKHIDYIFNKEHKKEHKKL